MAAITEDLARLLAKVDRPGDFFTAGTIELLAPSLQVDGVGPIALPLLPVQADQPDRRRRGGTVWPWRGNAGRSGGAADLADRTAACAPPWPALAANPRCHRHPSGRRAWRGRADRSRVLQAADLRPGQLLRRTSRYREGPWHVRHPGDRAAFALRRRRTRGAPRRARGCASTSTATIRPRPRSPPSMPTACTRCCRSPTAAG